MWISLDACSVGDRRDTRSDAEAYCFGLAQFVNQGVDFLCIRPSGVEDGFGVVEDDQHFLGGEERTQGCQVIGILNTCTDDLGESDKEMDT